MIWSKNSNANLVEFKVENLKKNSEQELWYATQQLKSEVNKNSDFVKQVLFLGPKIEKFFEEVMVMDEDLIVRSNRLVICKNIHDWSLRFLDLRELVVPK